MKPAIVQIAHAELEPGVVLITVAGRMVLGAQGGALDELIIELLAQGRRKFIVDAGGLTHIDSTGIGRFIVSYGKVSQAGGVILVAGASGMVREGFRVMRLDSVFGLYPDVEAARNALP